MKLRVLEICKEKGVTQKQLSKNIGMSETGLSKSINGNPTLETLIKIARSLDVPITELFAETEPIFGVLIVNGVTHRIETFDQLERLCEACRVSN